MFSNYLEMFSKYLMIKFRVVFFLIFDIWLWSIIFSKEILNTSKSINRTAIYSHDRQDFEDLKTMKASFDIHQDDNSDDSDFSMSSATNYAASNVSASRKVKLWLWKSLTGPWN